MLKASIIRIHGMPIFVTAEHVEDDEDIGFGSTTHIRIDVIHSAVVRIVYEDSDLFDGYFGTHFLDSQGRCVRCDMRARHELAASSATLIDVAITEGTRAPCSSKCSCKDTIDMLGRGAADVRAFVTHNALSDDAHARFFADTSPISHLYTTDSVVSGRCMISERCTVMSLAALLGPFISQ